MKTRHHFTRNHTIYHVIPITLGLSVLFPLSMLRLVLVVSYSPNPNHNSTVFLKLPPVYQIAQWCNPLADNYIIKPDMQISSEPRLVILEETCPRVRDHSVCGSSQWVTTLQCNVVSHWLSPYTEWYLKFITERTLWKLLSFHHTKHSL